MRLCRVADELHQRLSRSPVLAIWWPRRRPRRFLQDPDPDTIAARVGFSQLHISRLRRRALARMRAHLVEP